MRNTTTSFWRNWRTRRSGEVLDVKRFRDRKQVKPASCKQTESGRERSGKSLKGEKSKNQEIRKRGGRQDSWVARPLAVECAAWEALNRYSIKSACHFSFRSFRKARSRLPRIFFDVQCRPTLVRINRRGLCKRSSFEIGDRSLPPSETGTCRVTTSGRFSILAQDIERLAQSERLQKSSHPKLDLR